MDRKIFLEGFNNSNTISVTPAITPSRNTKIYSSINTPIKLLKQGNSSAFVRPKSAKIVCHRIKVSGFQIQKPQNKNFLRTEDIKPWSKSTSPFNSRPSSSKHRNKKIDLLEARIPTIKNYIVLDTTSSMITEHQNFSRYESLNQECKMLENAELSSNEPPLFATEVPSFLHQLFPARKIQKQSIKKSSTFNLPHNFPSVDKESKSKLPLKVEYFNLKRRYYPVKYKLNYIPRHSSPFRQQIIKKKKRNSSVKT